MKLLIIAVLLSCALAIRVPTTYDYPYDGPLAATDPGVYPNIFYNVNPDFYRRRRGTLGPIAYTSGYTPQTAASFVYKNSVLQRRRRAVPNLQFILQEI